MQELRVPLADETQTLMRLTREGNVIRSYKTDPDTDEVVIRYERRTEIRDGV
jgi:hypothetical protein